MSINVVDKIDDFVKIKHVLISVSDKSRLEEFIPDLLKINPEIIFFSTGGTYAKIKEMLGDIASSRVVQVSDYTGQPETQGGLIKTLDYKIYLGLLTETYNAFHQDDLTRTGAVPIDMAVVNLYPFEKTISSDNAAAEEARGNIDIGGPCMVRASAKNFLRVASVVDPDDYGVVIDDMRKHQGRISLAVRYRLAQKAFSHTAAYDAAISQYLERTDFRSVKKCYQFEK
jgi:phosphoribosylaminoimidazolecarboxamide formyltransferase / IMP cyclohydrolase